MNFSGGEKLTRFIFSRRHFSIEKEVVKYGAFMPPPDSADLSVFCISSVADSAGWKMGRDYVQTEERRLKARADLSVAIVYENRLEVVPATKPHELHANITPFPPSRNDRARIARRLALASQLVVIPEV